jgi:galactose oxidase-like protein/glyoxal oxidase-like protein/PKD domain-containing protein
MNRLPSYLFGPACLLLVVFVTFTPSAGAQTGQGQWQTLPYTMPINPVHAALLYNGKVVIASGSGNVAGNTNFQAALWDPQAGTVTTQPVAWDMFCNGMVVLPDGRPFVMGGTLQYDPFHGELRTSTYDPATNAFTDQQSMAHGRWYPTGTVLSDGRVMVFSGLNETGGTNTSVEFYSASSGWSAAFSAPWTPPLYPRMHQLPNGNVFYSGSTTGSSLFNPATHTWTTNVAFTNYSGTRTYGTSVLLPLTPANNYTPKVIIMGGGSPSTNTTEIIDLSAATPKWVYGPNMSQPRIEMNATILPNGQVLALGGSLNDEDTTTASLNADLYDPGSNTFIPAGAEVYARLYHSVSLLLPDGTVWVAGGNPQRGTYEQHMEIYSPAYLFNADGTPATRPTISSTSSSIIGYGGAFQVQTPDAANISSVVLMRNGAVTHAFDMDQRYVGLTFTIGSGVLNVTGPPNGNIAPPGYYMLFILNNAGVPSIATMVKVSPSANDVAPTGTITSPASNVAITAGQSVFYSGTGSDPDGTISAYSWSFPGGSPSSSSLANPGNVTYATPGTYVTTFTVTDNVGLTDPNPPTRTITVQPDFSLSASPSSQTVVQGGGTSFTATVTAGSGFSGTVSLSVSGLPTGATASFSPASISASGSSTLSVTTSSSTAPGSYSLTVTASSGTLSHTANVALVVSADFSIAVTPSSATASRGSSTFYTVTITPNSGFNGTVSFSVSGLPRRTNASFNPSSITTSGSSSLTVSTNHKTPTGTFTLTISATSGGLTHEQQVTLTVQ